jgi:FtsP/CotA-like multicopper oxidase with cupredoxin domain
MAEYKDESRTTNSLESLDEVEMQEQLEDFEEDRLLPNGGLESAGDVVYKREWHIRTGWAIAFSLMAVVILTLGLMLFVKHVIISDTENGELGSAKGIGSFRRPDSDYILDPNWNFKAPKRVREYKWTIVDVVGNPDGVFRPMLTINGQFPGPMIECNEGDTLVIDIDNQSVNATAMHFHGIFQNGTNFMDGTTGITQCPIAPKSKFRYEFTINGQSGSYYYHGHQGVQASDGLVGPLIVHARDEKKLQKLSYDSDRVVLLQDHYHDLSSGLLVTNLQPGSEGSPIPDGCLINGLNQRDCSTLPQHRMCDNTTTTIPSLDLKADANHRLRFINVGAFAWFQVTVDEHQFAVTEVDGTDIYPSYESSMMISPAQRYSMVLTTNQSTSDSFWLRARMVSNCWNGESRPADEAKAIIHYASGSSKRAKALLTQPTSRNTNSNFAVQCKDMNTTSYIPVAYQPPPETADHTYYLQTNMKVSPLHLERGFFNESSFRGNLQKPTLHRTVEGLSSGNETFKSMASSDGVNKMSYDIANDFLIQHTGVKVVDVILQNFDEGNHPMHLHGHKVWVLGQGRGNFPGFEIMGLKGEGQGALESHEGVLDNVMRRDVATLEGYGWLALRFIADNPGVWAFHCHMAWHSESGLVMQFLDRVEEVAKWEVPASNRALCEARLEDLEKGAIPKDSQWIGTSG